MSAGKEWSSGGEVHIASAQSLRPRTSKVRPPLWSCPGSWRLKPLAFIAARFDTHQEIGVGLVDTGVARRRAVHRRRDPLHRRVIPVAGDLGITNDIAMALRASPSKRGGGYRSLRLRDQTGGNRYRSCPVATVISRCRGTRWLSGRAMREKEELPEAGARADQAAWLHCCCAWWPFRLAAAMPPGMVELGGRGVPCQCGYSWTTAVRLAMEGGAEARRVAIGLLDARLP